jgi:hypothetical protein
MLARVATLPHVTGVVSPYAAGQHAISRDGTIGFATVHFDERADTLPKAAVDRVITTAEATRSANLDVQLGGQAIEQAQQASLGFATIVGIAAAIVILLISLGSFSAMGLPIATALLGLGAGIGVINLVSHVIDMPSFASELALMIGLGVGVDYALFIVTRFRENYRTNGEDVDGAVAAALNTSGRAVLFAGATRCGRRGDRRCARPRRVAHASPRPAQPDGPADRPGRQPPGGTERRRHQAGVLAPLGAVRAATPRDYGGRSHRADARVRCPGARAPPRLERRR